MRPSLRSLRGLDIVNLLLTDVKDGVGIYLSVYLLTEKHWDPSEIGIVMAVPGFAGIFVQPPSGALIDNSRHKRLLFILASVVIALCCLTVLISPEFYPIFSSQLMVGFAQSVFAPCVAAISLGMVGHALLSKRIGRNESFNHLGNMLAAIIAGLTGYFISYEGIFYFSIFQCIAIICAICIIRENDIDHQLARAARVNSPSSFSISSIKEVFTDKNVLLFMVAMAVFHLANAAMLPLLGQKMGIADKKNASLYLSAAIIMAQAVMVFAAFMAGKHANKGRKKLLLLAFLLLPVRGLLFSLTDNPYILTLIQVLDGTGAGIFGVVSILMMADLSKGTGHFNLLQGVTYSAMGLGAALSNIYAGYLVKAFGYNTGFACLGIAGFLAFLFFLFLIKETRDLRNKYN